MSLEDAEPGCGGGFTEAAAAAAAVDEAEEFDKF